MVFVTPASAAGKACVPHLGCMHFFCLFRILLILTGACALLPAQSPNDTYLHHLRVKDGLPSDRVFHIHQDRKGFIWFATESGLCRYDGYRFENFTVEDGISKNEVRRLYEDRQGRLWILTRFELTVLENGIFSVVDTFPRILEKRVLSMQQDSASHLWLTTLGNVHRISPDGHISHFSKGELGAEYVSPVLEFVSPSGEVWLSAGDHFVAMRDTVARRIPLTYPIEGSGISYASATYLSSGQVLYSSAAGLVLMSQGEQQTLVVPTGRMMEGFDPASITTLFEDVNRLIWVASDKNGLIQFRIEAGQMIPERHLLPGVGVNHLLPDREGNLWIATHDGVYMRSGNAAAISQTEAARLMPDPISSIKPGKDGRLWIVAKTGRIRVAERLESEDEIDLRTTLNPQEEITDFEMLDDGSLLIGTNQGLLMYENGQARRFYGLGYISTIKLQEGGGIWIGSAYDAYRCTREDLRLLEDPNDFDFPNRAFEVRARIDTLISHPQVQDMLAASDGSVWISQVEGLLHLVNDDRIQMADSSRVFRADVQDMEQAPDSSIWFGTNGSGLIVIKGDAFWVINAERGLPGEVINDVLVDGDSAIWIATNNGIGKISGYSFEENRFPITSWYTQKDGILGASVNQVFRYNEKIYAISAQGLSALNEVALAQIDIPPPVYITEVRINDGKGGETGMHLDFRENNIHLFFAGLTYRNLGRVRFRYRLEGAKGDEVWKETFQNNLIYAGLSPGHYRFQVTAVNQEGLESTAPAHFEFVIEPPFYQRVWFLGLIALLIFMLVFLLVRYFMINQQRAQLQRLVNEQTAELNENLNELTRANRELEQFAYAASHDLKTPLRTVIGHLQLLEKRYKGRLDQDADEFIAFAVGGAKKMNVMINDLLNYARVGRQKIDFVPVDLNETLASVRRMLSILLEEPDVMLEVEKLPVIKGIPTQWELLFQNLIENGLKFNHSAPKKIRISAEDTPDYWRVYVADNGIGIAEEYQSKIFELFQRLHTTEFPGTGIGLAMCKKIVELHNGSIFIQSEPGKGTTFCITIAKDL